MNKLNTIVYCMKNKIVTSMNYFFILMNVYLLVISFTSLFIITLYSGRRNFFTVGGASDMYKYDVVD